MAFGSVANIYGINHRFLGVERMTKIAVKVYSGAVSGLLLVTCVIFGSMLWGIVLMHPLNLVLPSSMVGFRELSIVMTALGTVFGMFLHSGNDDLWIKKTTLKFSGLRACHVNFQLLVIAVLWVFILAFRLMRG